MPGCSLRDRRRPFYSLSSGHQYRRRQISPAAAPCNRASRPPSPASCTCRAQTDAAAGKLVAFRDVA